MTEAKRQLPRVKIEIYAQIVGLAPDQIAGFRRWAQLCKLGPRTRPEWDEAWKTFLARKV